MKWLIDLGVVISLGALFFELIESNAPFAWAVALIMIFYAGEAITEAYEGLSE
jgi:hypothetical protein